MSEIKEAGLARTAFISHPDFVLHDPGATHPECPDRVRALLSHLEKADFSKNFLRIMPEPADEKWIELVHPSEYVRLIEQAAVEAPSALDQDTRLSSNSYYVAKLAVGGALAAVDVVMGGGVKNAFAAVRPPGHHALAGRAMGFCLFNNVAIAARYLQEKFDLKRILVVDWDVHHGNGTQDIFYSDPSVLFFSMHQYPFYPGTGSAEETGANAGEGFTVNIPIPSMAGNKEVVFAFREKLVPVADLFQPEFVLISAGFDGHQRDPLAQLQLTEEGFVELTRVVMEVAEKYAHGRVVSLLEGGYDLEGLMGSVEAHLKILAKLQ